MTPSLLKQTSPHFGSVVAYSRPREKNPDHRCWFTFYPEDPTRPGLDTQGYPFDAIYMNNTTQPLGHSQHIGDHARNYATGLKAQQDKVERYLMQDVLNALVAVTQQNMRHAQSNHPPNPAEYAQLVQLGTFIQVLRQYPLTHTNPFATYAGYCTRHHRPFDTQTELKTGYIPLVRPGSYTPLPPRSAGAQLKAAWRSVVGDSSTPILAQAETIPTDIEGFLRACLAQATAASWHNKRKFLRDVNRKLVQDMKAIPQNARPVRHQ